MDAVRVIENQFSKIQCLRAYPEVANFTGMDVCSSGSSVCRNAGSSAGAEFDKLERDHRVYMQLSHGLLSRYNTKDCIIQHCIGASSTNRYPEEDMENTLEAADRIGWNGSYWSSRGYRDPALAESLMYRLQTDLCLVDEIKMRPFKAFFRDDEPIYSAERIRFQMGYTKTPLWSETTLYSENEGQLIADSNYIWTYTSPEFPMLQENVLQSFKLPHPVLCIGGVVKIELLGGVVKDAFDGLYYICVSHVQVVGMPLSGELCVDEMEPFEVPGFPVRAAGSKATLRGFFQYPGVEKEHQEMLHAEATADGLLFNTFRGIEGTFLDAYAAALGKSTWAVGPTCASTSMADDADAKAGRGKPADVDAGHIVSWLDARPPSSVLYVSFGSISQLTAKQLAKLARGLEASGRPFVWAIKEAKADAAVRALLDEEGFEARVKDRGLLVRGWAPQVTILSHPAVGGFLTHCGWNGTLEALSLGVPALTWPTIADQFCSEQLLVDVLGVGVRSGVKIPAMYLPKEAEGVQVESDDVEKAIAELMGGGPEGETRRSRAKEIAAEARATMEEGGSSHSDLTDLISYVSELSRKKALENSTALPPEDAGKIEDDGAVSSAQSELSCVTPLSA